MANFTNWMEGIESDASQRLGPPNNTYSYQWFTTVANASDRDQLRGPVYDKSYGDVILLKLKGFYWIMWASALNKYPNIIG